MFVVCREASTITLAPRCSHGIGLSRTSYGGISLQSLYSLQLAAPNISKLVCVYPFFTTCFCDRRGAPWASGGAPSQGVRPLPLPRGHSTHPAFLGGWWAMLVPNPPKIKFEVGSGTNMWSVVGVVPRKKNGENGKTKFPTLLGRIFAAHIIS